MRILILRIGRLGDMIMILPAVMEIRKHYPDAEIHLITSSDGIRLFKQLYVPNIHLISYRNALPWRIFDAYRIKKHIRNQAFDLIYCFESKKRTISWLPSSAKILQHSPILQHYAQRCVQLVNPESIQHSRCDYFPFMEKPSDDFLLEHGVQKDTFLIGLHPTYSGYAKHNRGDEPLHRLWPQHYFSDLVERIIEHANKEALDIKIIINLLPEERAIGEAIARNSPENLIFITPDPNFRNYIHYIKRLNLLITPNTGVMHLAAALNTPTVALFSRESPEDCGPFMPENRCKILCAEDYPNEGKIGLARIPVNAVMDSILDGMLEQ